MTFSGGFKLRQSKSKQWKPTVTHDSERKKKNKEANVDDAQLCIAWRWASVGDL